MELEHIVLEERIDCLAIWLYLGSKAFNDDRSPAMKEEAEGIPMVVNM